MLRALLSVILGLAISVAPFAQVLAQTEQQSRIQADTTQDNGQTNRVIRVPPMTPETAPLWQHLASPSQAHPFFPDERPAEEFPPPPSTAKGALITVAVVVVVTVLVIAVLVALTYRPTP